MKLIATGAGDDADRAARSQVRARIERRTADLELLNRFVGNVRRRGADVLVGDVHAVNLDARRTPHAPADGDADHLVLGRVEIAPVAHLHARFELRQVEEVAPVERQILYRLGRDHAVNRRTRRVDGSLGARGRDFHYLLLRADLQRDRKWRHGPDFDVDVFGDVFVESGLLDRDGVGPGLQVLDVEIAALIGRSRDLGAGPVIFDDHPRAR